LDYLLGAFLTRKVKMKKAAEPAPTRKAKEASSSSGLKRAFAPKSVAVMYRPGTKEAHDQAKELAGWLLEQGLSVFCTPGQKLITKCKDVTAKNLDEVDWVITLGGDGTYLRAVHMLEGRQTPILGVNMGNLGFLTETRLEDMYKAIACTLKGEMEFRPRTMLRVEVRRNGKTTASHIALNDAVLERGSNTHLINLEIYSQSHLVGQVKADALIVASPTGSTAYNLAAGGPILHPEVRAIVVTPVCPHALTSRPLIFPDDQQLAFRVMTRDKKAILTVDGVNRGEITIDDEVVVVRNDVNHFVIRKPSSNYFSLLREKLKFGQRN
jgi:NAD+ kinase